MFQSIPSDALETDRLLIRQPTRADFPAVVEAVQESMTELRPWMPWVQNGYTMADGEAFVRRHETPSDTEINWSLFDKTDNRLLGSIGLHDVQWAVPRFEIGYWLRTSAVGHGYMTEAVVHLTHLCRDRFNARRMTIRCDSANLRSRQVAERADYIYESRTVNDRRSPLDNSLRDMLTFAMTWPDDSL